MGVKTRSPHGADFDDEKVRNACRAKALFYMTISLEPSFVFPFVGYIHCSR